MSESNSKNMTVEDLLVQDLKENRLGALIGNEDKLAELAARAINEALFNERIKTVGSGYNQSTQREPSPVMKAAQECADRAVTKVIDLIIEELLKNPKTFEAIQTAVASLFPSLVLRYLDHKAMELHSRIQMDAVQKLAQAFMSTNDPDMFQAIQNAYHQYTSSSTQKIVP